MLDKNFFNRNAEVVAKELLGKILVRRINENGVGKELKARIVETEAYFDEKDPASRARQNGDLRDTMKMEAGTILVYGVHNSWMINFVTDEKGKASAVLIRAVEPLNFEGKCNGPGLLTKALRIDKSHHKKNILNDNEIWIENIFDSQENSGNIKSINLESRKSKNIRPSITESIKLPITKINNKNNNFEIIESFRIGVKKDLPKKLRFYIKDSMFVSRK